MCFFGFEFELLGAPPVGSLFTNEEQKRLACVVLNTSATRASSVYDVIDAGRWAQNGSSRSHVVATVETSVFRKQDGELTEKQ